MDEADAKLAEAPLSGADERAVQQDSLTGSKGSWRRRVTWIAVLVVLLAAALVLPPLVNIGNYKKQITALMSRSMGRPVRLSGVELRLLPMPGFVLRDLSVGEDPEFGAEPILSARTVVASIRVLSLWRGRIEISRVSVDEASLNLVRAPEGKWNLDSLIMGAQPVLAGGAGAGKQAASVQLPYLEATDSRVNLKTGSEKTPFSLVDTDLSLWQDAPGQWRVRLRGQPMRTDIPMSLADTGEVRLEANLHSGAELRAMPLKLDLEWRNAQLGQLSRLVTGSDAGWRGDVTLDVAVQGTPDSAQTKARLRATGVRREEFAPDTPLDFDANCDFRYQHSLNAAHDVTCDTAIGDGQLHLKAELPGKAGPPVAMLEVKDLPLQAGLDLLRTVRGGLAPGIQAKGAANGSLSYKETSAAPELASVKEHSGVSAAHRAVVLDATQAAGNLAGTLTLRGAQFTGGALKEALKLPEITLTSALIRDGIAPDLGGRSGLTAKFALPLGTATAANSQAGAEPASIQIGLTAQGYQATASGTAAIERLRDLAYAFGWAHQAVVDGFSGGTADFSVAARGPWIPRENASGMLQSSAPTQAGLLAGSLSGSLVLHKTEWHAGYLGRPLELAQGTVTLAGGDAGFDGDFSYGNGKDPARDLVRGSLSVRTSANCSASGITGTLDCPPQIVLKFGALDAAVLEAALLGAEEEKSLLSPLMDRVRSPDRAQWPAIGLRMEAESLTLGPAVLQKPLADLRFSEGAAVLEHWEAGLLGGTAAGTGRIGWADDKPQYMFEGTFAHVNAAPLGALLGGGQSWSGGPVSGSGNVALAGRKPADLAASATGLVHFDWERGAGLLLGETAVSSFDNWRGTAAIQGGKAVLGANSMTVKRRLVALSGAVAFGGPDGPAMAFTDGKQAAPAKSAAHQAVK